MCKGLRKKRIKRRQCDIGTYSCWMFPAQVLIADLILLRVRTLVTLVTSWQQGLHCPNVCQEGLKGRAGLVVPSNLLGSCFQNPQPGNIQHSRLPKLRPVREHEEQMWSVGKMTGAPLDRVHTRGLKIRHYFSSGKRNELTSCESIGGPANEGH